MENIFVYLFFIPVFLVKITMFYIHLWLPKAHVEAPVSGSMILAGIMLKLGGYGLLHVMKFFLLLGLKVNYLFVVSLICVRQSDMKSLTACSSVVHMGLALGGILSFNIWGFWGSCSFLSLMGCVLQVFCLANLSYEWISSRSLYVNKGLSVILTSLSLWWFLFCSSNMAAPPSMNLLSEILLISSLVSHSWLNLLFLSLVSFFKAVYSLFLFSYSQHGKFFKGSLTFHQGLVRKYLLLFLHTLISS